MIRHELGMKWEQRRDSLLQNIESNLDYPNIELDS